MRSFDRGRVADSVYVTRTRALLLTTLLLATIAFGVTASSAQSAGRSETQLLTLNHQIASAINVYRHVHGLRPLRVSIHLNNSALQHSAEMGARGYFDHPSANGTAFWKRIQSFYSSSHYPYWTVGENLLWSSANLSAVEAMKMWIASPEHRHNLLNKNWRDLGVSSVRAANAGGVYGGNTVTIITTDFGARH